MTRYQISLNAENLRKMTILRRPPSTYAKVVVTGGPQNGTIIGETKVVDNTTDPDWMETLYVVTDTTIYMPIRVDIIHKYNNGAETMVGQANFEVMEIYQSAGHGQRQDLNGNSSNGTLHISVQESIQGDLFGRVDLHIRGLDIRNIEAGIFGLGRSDPFFEIAKKSSDYSTGISRFDTVYRSHHIINHLNPFWEPFSLTTEELAFCNAETLIRVVVKDYQKSGNHRTIGMIDTTLNALMDRVAVKGNADREKAIDIFDEEKAFSGKIVVLKATIS